jgi:hypothetical protein
MCALYFMGLFFEQEALCAFVFVDTYGHSEFGRLIFVLANKIVRQSIVSYNIVDQPCELSISSG